MHLNAVRAVLQFIVVAHLFGRELALLADGHEADAQLEGQGGADDETPRFDGGDLVDLGGGIVAHQLIDGGAKTRRVLQQRRDIAEHHSWLGIVRNRTDEGFEEHESIR